MDVRPCADAEVAALESWMPTGRSRRHAVRFERQEAGLATYLVAWSGGAPVGSGEVRWDGCEAPEVVERFPGCPEVNALNVWPAQFRSRGIGTAIVRAAEELAAATGLRRIGLGVTDDNDRAAALYLRLGYAETGCRYLDRQIYLGPGDERLELADPARFLVRGLGGAG